MATFWRRLLACFDPANRLSTNGEDANRIAISEPDPVDLYPEVAGAKIFDPALKSYINGYRRADPPIEDPTDKARWQAGRMELLGHLLRLTAASQWGGNLILRGSLLLTAWLDAAAREPADIDWVVRPKDLSMTDERGVEMLDELVYLIKADPDAGNVVVEAQQVSTCEIWTYERAPGKRIIIPWRMENLPASYVQMDIVFGEDLWETPVETRIPASADITVWSASKEISLAWKLLWLQTDSYPQGKDLYDATLLAERTRLSKDLLIKVLLSGELRENWHLTADFPMKWNVDWDNFKLEYPWVEGEAADWQSRLTRALAPTFPG